MEYARLVIADEIQTMLGDTAVRSIARRVGAIGDCGTCGDQLGPGKVSLVAYGDRDSARGHDGGSDGQLVEVIAHHASCRESTWQDATAPTSPSPTYRAQAISLPMIGVPDPDDPDMQRLHFNARQRRLRWRERRRGLRSLAVCAAVVNPTAERFLYRLGGTGGPVDVDAEEAREWGLGGFGELDMFTPVPRLSAEVTDTRLAIGVPQAGARWEMPLIEPLTTRARNQGGVLLVMSTEGDPYTRFTPEHFAELLRSDKTLAGWVSIGPHEQTQAFEELLDQYHSRASVRGGDNMIVQPGQVLDNIALAMERLDIDINTPISIEEDVASQDEIQVLVENLDMASTLAVHVVNTAMRIMATRYPADVVSRPLPPEYDLRKLHPELTISDHEHQVAATIFNQRTTSPTDLTEDDVAAALEPLDTGGKMTVFVTLFYMYGSKIGAMKYRTGIE